MDNRRKRIHYRASHRGIKEMDLILTSFSNRELANLSAAELGQFEALLDLPDQDLYAWITGAEVAPDEHRSDVLRRLQDLPPVTGIFPQSAINRKPDA